MTQHVDDPVVLFERVGEVAVLRLHRPNRLNAFTVRMREELEAAFDRCDADDEVRAVVLTGSGRAYCAGADLGAGGDSFVLEPADGGAPPDEGGLASLRIFRSMKPVVVAVNGPAVGVGVTSTLPADVRIASETARFGFVFTRRGLVPEACSSWFLPRIVGIATALEWMLSGRLIDAREALAKGLVREVVPPERVVERAIEVARDLVSGTAPVSVALTRRMLWSMLGAEGPEVAHVVESRGIYERGRSADIREGVEAFLSKRDPSFVDRVSDGLPDLFGQ
ncbi:enoyl-CoA hydratase-related protein [Nocardia aurantia]|uniref:1,2-epoxyphenylacetyl-CoA isomerase n=1 Tax=Nocardia aurantia TaxID=2585199 RepID=A0A7K0DJ82_9NOCA|nr:enoyl-CoA hydratase-related protein [Nocardia aurantia]MQY25876.1 1,2-epoxyphenylacetyl-CoA isomerase [Nocardia aurantia]